MAEEKAAPDVARFAEEIHDVTCCLEALFCGKTTLILGPEEAELTRTCLMGVCSSKKRGPYGELGTVDADKCCCFYGFGAASLMGAEEGMQCIGCGCEIDMTDQIVEELKKRQGLRGDRAKVRMAESTIASLSLLHKKVDAIMASMELAPITADAPGTDEMVR